MRLSNRIAKLCKDCRTTDCMLMISKIISKIEIHLSFLLDLPSTRKSRSLNKKLILFNLLSFFSVDDSLLVKDNNIFTRKNRISKQERNITSLNESYSCYLCDREPCDLVYKCENALMVCIADT